MTDVGRLPRLTRDVTILIWQDESGDRWEEFTALQLLRRFPQTTTYREVRELLLAQCAAGVLRHEPTAANPWVFTRLDRRGRDEREREARNAAAAQTEIPS